MIRFPRFAALLLSLTALPAWAEPLSLKDAVRYALDHNAMLAAERQRVEVAAHRADEAGTAGSPELTLGYVARASSSPLDAFAGRLLQREVTAADFDPARLNHPGVTSLFVPEVAAEVPLYTGGRVAAEVLAASELHAAAEHELGRMRDTIALRVRDGYRAAQAARESVRILDEAIRSAERIALTAAGLVREQRAVASDRLAAELHRDALRANREQALGRERETLVALRRILGHPLDIPLTLERWTPPGAGPEVNAKVLDAMILDPGAAERAALEGRTDLKALAATSSAASARIETARAGTKPTVGLRATQSWYNDGLAPGPGASSVSAVVRWNFWNGGRSDSAVGTAVAEAYHTELAWEAQRSDVQAEVRQSLAKLEGARARLKATDGQSAKATDAARAVAARYGESRTILLDVLGAERTLVEIRSTRLDAELGVLNAESALVAAIGGEGLRAE